MKRHQHRFDASTKRHAWSPVAGWLSMVAFVTVLLAAGQLAQAAPFRGLIVPFTQPDGTRVEVQGWGDEFTSVFETHDGYTAVFDPALKAYCYARQATDGSLVSTGVQIHKGNAPQLGLDMHLRKSNDLRTKEVAQRWQRWNQGMQIDQRWAQLKGSMAAANNDGISPVPPNRPTVGIKAGLCLLIDFDDAPATIPQAEIINFCNGDDYSGFGNACSVKKYYQDVSGGLLTYTNVVTAYVRIPNSLHPKSYYNNLTNDAGINANNLIKDAMNILMALPNYATEILPTLDGLSVDADNQVLAFNVFYAGDNGGVWSYGLWPHSWSLSEVGAISLSEGGKKLWRYQISNIGDQLEIGTFCHENGHMLCGYPDLYDYDYDSVGGAGMFCLMGYGDNGPNPVQICAYLKRAAGWGRTTEVTSASAINAVVNAAAGDDFNHFYRFQKPGTPTEYFIVEGRYGIGHDQFLPASGIAIWHIDELGDRDNQSLLPNTTHANYECMLVQADNRWDFERYRNAGDTNDLYYVDNSAQDYSNELSDNSHPNAQWWDGTPSGFYCADFGFPGPTMNFFIGTPNGGLLNYVTNVITGGNNNGMIDINECNLMSVVITNRGHGFARDIRATLSSVTPGVFIAQGASTVPDIAPSSVSSNRTPFKVSTTPGFICGTRVEFELVLTSDAGIRTNRFQVSTGVRGKAFSFNNNSVISIPDADMNGIYSGVTISNFNGTLAKVGVSLFIQHTFAADLAMELIGPNGERVLLSAFNGRGGNNYGIACNGIRTTFDDDAPQSIASGSPPFAGEYKPEQSLSVFGGMLPDEVNGLWRLHIIDAVGLDVGTLQCWSLLLSPIVCGDGGGECEGADLSVSLKAAPNGALGSPLTFTMVVSNSGPSTAKNVSLAQSLPPGSALAGVSMTQGTYSTNVDGGLLNCNLGNIPAGGSVTVVPTIIPNQFGVFTSVATVGSISTDNNLANNQASWTVSIENARADLSLKLTDSPDPVLAGGVLTYTMTVLNYGPNTATNVIVTNILPATVDNVDVKISQGSFMPVLPGYNVIIANLGTLASNATAQITVTCIPRQAGVITDTAVVVSDQLDTYPINNRATVTTTVGPAADVSVALTATPNPIAISDNLTYQLAVSNSGPVSASGLYLAFNLPKGVKVSSAKASQGTLTVNQTGLITGDLGTLAAGAGCTVTVVVRTPASPGALVADVSVYATQNDPDLSNNSATCLTDVRVPSVNIVAGSTKVVTESLKPNGVVDPSETVSAQFELKSVGTITASNVTATLLVGGGVAQVASGAQNYGAMPAGSSVTRAFTFTANSVLATDIHATMLVQAGTNLFTNVFTIATPSTTTLSNTNAITIPEIGAANPYPSTIDVSGLTGALAKVTVSLVGLNHTYPHDVSMLLVGPNRYGVVLMAHIADLGEGVTNATIVLDDEARLALPAQGVVDAGTYKPTVYGGLPVFNGAPAGPYGTNLISFNGTNPNGTWALYIIDDSDGDSGAVSGGWQLGVTTLIPSSKVADLVVNGSSSASQLLIGGYVTNVFTITNAGPDVAQNVLFTNTLSAGLTYDSSSIKGTNQGQVFTTSLGSIPLGGSVKVTNVAKVTGTNLVTATASVGAAEIDLNPSNNLMALSIVGLPPSADISVAASGPANLVAGLDATYTVTVVNRGPSTAPSVTVTNLLPASVVFHQATSDLGTVSTNLVIKDGVSYLAVYAKFASFPVNTPATVNVSVGLPTPGMVTNFVCAGSAIADPLPADNVAVAITTVAKPGPMILAGNARLISEGVRADGVIESGETVIMDLTLANQGTGSASALNATLLSSSTGITAFNTPAAPTIGGVQDYGLVQKNSSATRRFAFTVSAKAGETVTLNLGLADGTNGLPQASFTFVVSGQYKFSSSAAIAIPDMGRASPYPSTINTAGLHGAVKNIEVTLTGLTHSFPSDLNIALFGPAGQSIVLMSHAGGAYSVSNLVLTFSSSVTNALPATGAITSGSYAACRCGSSSFLSGFPGTLDDNGFETFVGTDPNGPWSLYIYDDKKGDLGQIASGWSLALEVVDYINSVSDLAIKAQVPVRAFVEQNFPIQLVVTNQGPGSADNVIITNTLPLGVILVSSSGSQGQGSVQTNGVVLWNFGTIQAGGSAIVTNVVRSQFDNKAYFTGTVGSDSTDLEIADNTIGSVGVDIFKPRQFKLSAAYDKAKPGAVQLMLEGEPQLSYRVDYSTNLLDWSTLSTATPQNDGTALVEDRNMATAPYRFYRAVPLP